MKIIYSIILFIFVLLGCNHKAQYENSVFIGGEIINPQSEFVIIMQGNKIIDSLFLDDKNLFGATVKGINPGLYYFKHGYEFQYLYLEPNDSIRLRLNTWDFDETLVFEGKGSAKNELLLNLFLENEKEKSNFYTYFKLNEQDFTDKINNTLNRHSRLLTALTNTKKDLSDEFKYIAKAAINYPLYTLKELYPFYHSKRTNSKKIISLSPEFYNFRKSVNLNDSILSEFHIFQNYLTTHLYNLAYYKNDAEINNPEFYCLLIDLINTKIKKKSLKNRLLRKEIENLFINKPHLLNTNVLNAFYDSCTDSITIFNIKGLLKNKRLLEKNSILPNFGITNKKGKSITIKHLVKDKKSVIYLWSSQQISDVYLRKRVQYLNTNYPSINFIGINFDQNINYYSKIIKPQYSLPSGSLGNKYISKKYPRAIIIDENQNIIESFSVLTSWNLEKQLKLLTFKPNSLNTVND
jgi:uncharacterized lipoprotein NlpE involved in copper resistance